VERVYLSPQSEISQDKMTTLVDVIFVDSLDAGSIPATSTSLRQGFGWHAKCQSKPCFFACPLKLEE
jgi:hypothetical protein